MTAPSWATASQRSGSFNRRRISRANRAGKMPTKNIARQGVSVTPSTCH